MLTKPGGCEESKNKLNGKLGTVANFNCNKMNQVGTSTFIFSVGK